MRVETESWKLAKKNNWESFFNEFTRIPSNEQAGFKFITEFRFRLWRKQIDSATSFSLISIQNFGKIVTQLAKLLSFSSGNAWDNARKTLNRLNMPRVYFLILWGYRTIWDRQFWELYSGFVIIHSKANACDEKTWGQSMINQQLRGGMKIHLKYL